MCTAVTYHTKDHYFGRTLDDAASYEESVVITPRNYPFSFAMQGKQLALIGIAYVAEGYPLYYDAVNEAGLAMAGLRFQGNAVYQKAAAYRENIPSWAFLPWVLTQCETVVQAKALLRRTNLTDTPFSESLPPAPLHWMIADRDESVTVECTAEGMQIYENPVGVLTNNPPFPFHLQNLRQYLNLTAEEAENRFSNALRLTTFSRGMGSIGLPGDWSSASRFVRAAFVKENAVAGEGERASVSQMFHILGAVEQPQGCVHLGEGKQERTIYTACCNLERGIYYYKTYENHSITAVELKRENLDESHLICFPLRKTGLPYQENGGRDTEAADGFCADLL